MLNSAEINSLEDYVWRKPIKNRMVERAASRIQGMEIFESTQKRGVDFGRITTRFRSPLVRSDGFSL